MLEFDIYAYLIADGTLDTLLGSSATDSKIYPVRAPQGSKYPYITYDVSGYGDVEEYVHNERITFKIVSKSYTTAKNIRDRIRVLLDLQDLINITSANYRIEHSKLVGGMDLEDTVTDSDTEGLVKIIVQIYEFKFIDK